MATTTSFFPRSMSLSTIGPLLFKTKTSGLIHESIIPNVEASPAQARYPTMNTLFAFEIISALSINFLSSLLEISAVMFFNTFCLKALINSISESLSYCSIFS